MTRKLALTASVLAFGLAPSLALAHPGHAGAAGFMAGFGHPLGGLDHIMAMVMVGLFAWQLGGRALWLVPSAFIGVMALGGAIGMLGAGLPFVETGIALSLIGLGAAVAFNVRAPVAAAMAVAGLFALFHGHAHGAEIPENAGGLSYGLGFIAATALLHLAGIAAGSGLAKLSAARAPLLTRSLGALVAVAGVGILAGIV
jgi:urease accessory protein